ncbi:MAG: dynamin family protein [Mycobacterium sp.]
MPTGHRSRRRTAMRVAALIDEVEPHLRTADALRLSALRDDLDSTLRVALVGRVNSGKSTLLNALVGQRVAPTNETECTRVVTWYRFGAPARIEVVGLDGSSSTIGLHRGLPDDLGRPPDEIDHAVAYLPSATLRDYELIDTPGLAGTNSTSSVATRRALGDSSAARTMVAADVKVFLSDGAPRSDELTFLKEIGAGRVDTLALLSHADAFGQGALFSSADPIELAGRHAVTLHRRLAHVAGAVVPVSGLLAETVLTGRLTEDDARALHRLASVDDEELIGLLSGDDPSDDNGANVGRLLERVGEYGIMYGRRHSHSGAAKLGQWLTERSGLAAVRTEILSRFLHRSDVLKARRVFAELRRLASDSPNRAEIHSILEAAQMEPELHGLRELQALELMLQWDPEHRLVTTLDRLTLAADDASKLELGADTDQPTVAEAAKVACVRAHQERMTAVSAAEREAWTVLERSYQLIFTAALRSSVGG